ncbi:unnamed protein product [Pleuronectes platessa]|uniref:Uncharacterized protein n=1 Tax=Pleuronectes platessa TaxID=8262 RepID=A0A9N7Z791_PLEPL|nr:unnamed protein product [Pleuronectes platessa]
MKIVNTAEYKHRVDEEKQTHAANYCAKREPQWESMAELMRMSHRPHGDWASDITAALSVERKQFLTKVLHRLIEERAGGLTAKQIMRDVSRETGGMKSRPEGEGLVRRPVRIRTGSRASNHDKLPVSGASVGLVTLLMRRPSRHKSSPPASRTLQPPQSLDTTLDNVRRPRMGGLLVENYFNAAEGMSITVEMIGSLGRERGGRHEPNRP